MNGGFSLEESKGILEKTMIGRALELCGGNQTEASRLLKVHRNTIGARLKEYEAANGAKRKAPQSARKPLRKRATA